MELKKFFIPVVVMMAMACSTEEDVVVAVEDVPAEEVVDPVIEVVSPLGLSASQQKMVAPLNGFSVRLFQQLSSQSGGHSCVLSPLSAAFMLGMLSEGAGGETSEELLSALGFDVTQQEEVSRLFGQYISALPSLDADVSVAFANNVSLNTRFQSGLKQPFLSVVQDGYDASVFALDFSSPSSLQTLNDWSNSHTLGLIPTIADQLNAEDVLCLLNSVYFKGSWTDPFEEYCSFIGGFATSHGPIFIKEMSNLSTMQYGEQEGLKYLRLPMCQGHYAMTFVLPFGRKKSPLSDVINALTEQQLQDLTFTEEEVLAVIPIFSTIVNTDLISLLQGIGVNRLFSRESSELTGIADSQDGLYVSQMRQKTRIGIDEHGCEGSSITLGESSIAHGTPRPLTFEATEPFLYYISEVQSGTILFMGQFCGD